MSEKKSQSFNNPFPGLRAFKDSENHLFFGREEHIDDVLLKLDKNHFVAVVGTSGTGKSSLIKAGVLPALKGDKVSTATEKWEVVSMNPGSSPFLNLADAICLNTTIVTKEDKESFKDKLLVLVKNSTLGLAQAMRPVLDVNSKLLILIDQSEEVFRFSDEEETEAKKITMNDVQLNVGI